MFAAGAAVGLIGGIVFGVLADMKKRHAILIMAVCSTIYAVIILAMRFLVSYVAYFILKLVLDFIFPAVDLIGNAVILRTWGQRATGPMYAIHLGFGLGSAIGPFIARPFLSPEENLVNCTSALVTCGTTEIAPTSEPSRYPDGSRLEIPYAIMSCIILVVCGFMYALYIRGPPDELRAQLEASSSGSLLSQPLKEVCHPRTCANTSTAWAIFFLINLFFFYVWNTGREISIGTYVFTYATESDLGFSKDEAAALSGVYNLFYMLGRCVSIVISRWLTIQLMMSGEVVAVAVITVAMAIWGTSSQTAFAVLICSMGFFGSPLWPGQMSWLDNYITVTSTALFLVPAGASLGNIVFNPLYGAMLENKEYELFLGLIAVTGCLCCLQFIIQQVAGVKAGSRYQKPKQEQVYAINYSMSMDDVK